METYDDFLDALEHALDLLTYHGTIEPYVTYIGDMRVVVHALPSDQLEIDGGDWRHRFKFQRTATRPRLVI